VGRHGAGVPVAPVAVEHRRLPSSACAHWHTRPDSAPSWASETMFQPTLSRAAVARNSKWRRSKDRARRCKRGEDPAAGRSGARAPVAMEHRRLLSSACAHWHSWPEGTPSQASKTMFQRSSPGLQSILFAHLGMCMLETGDRD